MMMAIVLLIALVNVGCVEILSPLLVKNPEIERTRAEERKHEVAITAITNPNVTIEEAKLIADVYDSSAKHSKPTFISGVVSALYTREGQEKATLLLLTLGGWAMAGIKWAAASNANLGLVKTIVGIQKVRQSDTRVSAQLKAALSSEHEKAGLSRYMRKKVARTLGEA